MKYTIVMKWLRTRIFYSAVCIISFCFITYSCAGKIEYPVQPSPPEETAKPEQEIPSAESIQYEKEAVLTASNLIAVNIEKTFPVFSPEGKNESDKAVPQRFTVIAENLLDYAKFNSKIPKPDKITVKIIESQEINSISAGSAYIFITRNFLEAAENDPQKAALLAHELAHISLGHSLSRFDPTSLQTIKTSAEQCLYMIMGGYTESQEFEADGEAVRILTHAGFHPGALADVLRNTAPKLIAGTPDISSTHPSILQRITRINKETQ